MRVGMFPVDGHNFPSIPLMKLSSYHKSIGDSTELYQPFTGHYDRVYCSKVFSFTPDYEFAIDSTEVIHGGTGYAISNEGGGEQYHKELDTPLPADVEHMYPDYSLFNITDTAYGFLSRGCPRGCKFCVVGCKEGLASRKAADLSEFWNGQKNLVLCDPNILACPDWKDLLTQVADSKAVTEFNQGLDIRLMTEAKAELLKQVKISLLHFAWDRYEDKEHIVPRLKAFQEITGFGRHKVVVYVLCHFNTTLEQDLERIYTIRDIGFSPYVMLYNKRTIPRGDVYYRLARWCNSRRIFNTIHDFNDYKR